MVMSVTPMVCITLAFWLGRIGLIASGGCWAIAYGAAHITVNRIAKVKSESRFREIIVALLVVEFGALCIAPPCIGKESVGCFRQTLQLFTNPHGSAGQLRRSVMSRSSKVDYQITQRSFAGRTIASPSLHWNAAANCGVFERGPFTRNLFRGCGSCRASSRANSGR